MLINPNHQQKTGERYAVLAHPVWAFKSAWFGKAAKKDRDNIDDAALEAFPTLAKGYAELVEGQIKQMLQDKLLMELCHGNKTEI